MCGGRVDGGTDDLESNSVIQIQINMERKQGNKWGEGVVDG